MTENILAESSHIQPKPQPKKKSEPTKRYDIDLLKKYCQENEVELVKDYTNIRLNAKTKIEGKCKIDNCNNTFCKSFEYLYVFNNTQCLVCSVANGRLKTINTNMERYGVKTTSQNKDVHTKMKNTNLQKYGAEYSFLNKEVQNKGKITLIKNYGIHPFKSKEIQDKIKNINMERYGVENVLLNEEILKKSKATILERYGVTNVLLHKETRDKITATVLEKYGVDNSFKSEEVRQKIKATNIKKYGFEHPMQNPQIMENASKKAYKLKDYVFPSGKIVKVQGYEHLGLNELLKQNINETDIVTGAKNVPTIWYEDETGKKHRHYVDIFIPSENKCIEIKSTWTAKKKKDCIFLKQNAGKALGYKYEIWVYNDKKERVNCYE